MKHDIHTDFVYFAGTIGDLGEHKDFVVFEIPVDADSFPGSSLLHVSATNAGTEDLSNVQRFLHSDTRVSTTPNDSLSK